jgi:hypothetical protein
MGTMIKPLAASIQQPAQNTGTRTPVDHQAASKRDRELEEATRPLCVDCGVVRSFFIRRKNDPECKPTNLCGYCVILPAPLTDGERVDRRIAVVRAWREDMRRH